MQLSIKSSCKFQAKWLENKTLIKVIPTQKPLHHFPQPLKQSLITHKQKLSSLALEMQMWTESLSWHSRDVWSWKCYLGLSFLINIKDDNSNICFTRFLWLLVRKSHVNYTGGCMAHAENAANVTMFLLIWYDVLLYFCILLLTFPASKHKHTSSLTLYSLYLALPHCFANNLVIYLFHKTGHELQRERLNILLIFVSPAISMVSYIQFLNKSCWIEFKTHYYFYYSYYRKFPFLSLWLCRTIFCWSG